MVSPLMNHIFDYNAETFGATWKGFVMYDSPQSCKYQFDEVTVNSKTGDFNATMLAHVINTRQSICFLQTWLDRAGDVKLFPPV